VRLSLVVLLAACASAPKTSVEPPGRAQRVSIGSIEAYALADGHLALPNDGALFGVGHPPSETGDVLAAAGLVRDTIHLDIQCLLVKAGDRVILFDAGMGAFSPDAGHLPASLARGGVLPSAITDIFISHAHSDHIGGLVTKAGALAFPAATIHMSAPEWAALQADTADADSQRFVAVIASKVEPFEPGAQVLPVVKAVATPGHTVGHSSYVIGTAPDTLLYTGDVVHHAILSLQRPTWSVQVDTDHAAADALRPQMLATLAADHTHVFVPHVPFPGIGHVVVDGPGFAWKPD